MINLQRNVTIDYHYCPSLTWWKREKKEQWTCSYSDCPLHSYDLKKVNFWTECLYKIPMFLLSLGQSWDPLIVCEGNVMKESLVPRQNIILLPLHIKWGLMKQYNKGLHKNGHRFHFISQIFAGFSTANTRAKISKETQMCRLIKDSTNLRHLWLNLKDLCLNLLQWLQSFSRR